MSKILLGKKDFIDCINRLCEATDLQNKISALMRESRDNIENDFINGATLQINHESVVTKLLTKIMHDDEIYSDISYFIYELDYGRKYEPGMIKDNDGNEIDFSTAEKLYDYLVKNYEEEKTRPCVVYSEDDERKAIFHGFFCDNNDKCVVEYENGELHKAYVWRVKFTDK